MALNYQDASQPLQGGVVYNPNPGWWATLLSGIKDAGSAIGQGALDAAPYFLNGAGNSTPLPTSVLQNNPYNPSDISTPNNPNNFKIQNPNPYSSPLQQAYANLQTASSPKPQLAYTTLGNASVQRGLNGLVGVQLPVGEFGPGGLISQHNENFGQNSLIAQAPPVPGPGVVQQWSDAVPYIGMSTSNQTRTPHYAGYPQHMVSMPVAQIAQGDLSSEPYGYPRRGKQGESGAAYQMLHTAPQRAAYEEEKRTQQLAARNAVIQHYKNLYTDQQLEKAYGPNLRRAAFTLIARLSTDKTVFGTWNTARKAGLPIHEKTPLPITEKDLSLLARYADYIPAMDFIWNQLWSGGLSKLGLKLNFGQSQILNGVKYGVKTQSKVQKIPF